MYNNQPCNQSTMQSLLCLSVGLFVSNNVNTAETIDRAIIES